MKRQRWMAGTMGIVLVLSACAAAGEAGEPSFEEMSDEDRVAYLEEQAREEGALNSYGMPDDWANIGALFAEFLPKYDLTHTDTDMSSAEEIQKFDAEKNNPVADMGDIGIQFGQAAVEAGVLECYRPIEWDVVPDWAKHPDGCWMGWYLGTIAFAVNTKVVSDVPQSWADLLSGDYPGQVAMSDPRTTGQGAMSFLAATLANGGSESDLDPGFEYFRQLSEAGNLSVLDPSTANLEKGEVGIGIIWDFNALPLRDDLAGRVDIEVVIPSDGTVAAPYLHIINKYARHKNAARLFREYILSAEAQAILADGYVRPIRDDVPLPDKFPPEEEYAAVMPITDWDAATASIARLATEWTLTVGEE